MEKIYQEYGQYFYLPMTQGYSLAVPVTIGCSWDQCLYCDLNHGHAFRSLRLDEIEEKLIALQRLTAGRRRPVRKAVLAGGNPFCLNTQALIEIAELIRAYFPEVRTISSFARADDILGKTVAELTELKRWGFGELSVGVESGNDEILKFHRKGITRQANLQAMKKLESCGITYSAYIMLGLGGKRLSRENALDTASLLSQADPQVIIAVTLVLFKEAKLVELVRSREFVRLNALESILEEKLLLENLTMRNTIFNGTHKTNALILKGRLPQQQRLLLERIDQALEKADGQAMRSMERSKWKNWSLE